MSDLDLDRLGELWRDQLPAQTADSLRRSAAKVKRRARIAMIVDQALAVACVLTILYLIASNPKLEVLAVGAAAILMLVTSQLRQRRFRQLELKSLAGSTSSMIDQSISRVEATRKRARSGLLLIVPATLVGVLLGFVSRDTIDPLFDRIHEDPISLLLLLSLSLVALPAMIVHLFLTARRSRSELSRLETLRKTYQQEERATVSDE